MQKANTYKPVKLLRRGFDLGLTANTVQQDSLKDWAQGKPVVLKKLNSEKLDRFRLQIERSDGLYQSVLEGQQACEELFDASPYRERLEASFESLGSSFNEGDDQEIETVLFDAIAGDDVVAEDLWMKVSWLSFYEEDASLRFRFSFGVDLQEDVAADKVRQKYSASLAEAIFSESEIVTQNVELIDKLSSILQSNQINFVERIVYFNAPQGGAYLHHDRERGHAGVVYAQLSGHTFWLALPRKDLVEEVKAFVAHCQQSVWPKTIDAKMQKELLSLSEKTQELTLELESFSNEALIHLINETAEFVQQLIANGHSRQLEPGDVILLPQETEDSCCWHSVFNLGDSSGEALSFAIRGE